jgi:hypothetical protein
MKYLFILLFFVLTSCDMVVKPDLVIDGKEYVFRTSCVKSHVESKYEYHYGYNMMSGKFDWHWGLNNNTICDSTAVDTVEVNLEQKYYTKK